MTKRKVCLFGLSANPPTGKGGHFSFISHLASLKRCDPDNIQSSSTSNSSASTTDLLFDEVRVLPVYKHMFSVSVYILEESSGIRVFIYFGVFITMILIFILLF